MTTGLGCSTCDVYSDAPLHRDLHELEAGESTDVRIDARECWNATRVRLVAGSTYLLEVRGDSHWNNNAVRTGPEGFWAPALESYEPFRRVPEANWMAPIGTINGWQDAPFVIGRRCVYTPLLNGELVCYANDAPTGYFDNSGSITLTVHRLTPTVHPLAPPPEMLPVTPSDSRPATGINGATTNSSTAPSAIAPGATTP